MGPLWQDIRFAARTLARSPGFTLVVVAILMLGIGANTAIFSVVNAVLLRPLPFQNPDQLVYIALRFDDPTIRRIVEQSAQARGMSSLNSPFDFHEIRKRNHVFEYVAACKATLFVDISGDEPVNVLGACVSEDFFSCLGIRTQLGRGFRPEEDQPGSDQVVVLGYRYWRQRYGGDPGILGKDITFKDGRYTVVGILPARLHFMEYGRMSEFFAWSAKESPSRDVDVWKPLALTPEKATGPGSLFTFNTVLFARLKAGITLERAQAEMNIISGQLSQEHPERGKRSLLATGLQESLAGDVRPALWALLGTVVFVLLIACANVANMLLARSLGRQREVAIRTALGAGRLCLVRQFLTESILLSLLGAAGGLLLTVCLSGVLRTSLLSRMPRLSEIRVDDTVLCFTLATSVFTGALIGLAPILRFSELNVGRVLKEGSGAIRGGAHRSILHRMLLVVEIALSLILLTGAGLTIKSFWRLATVDLGYDPENVLVVSKGFEPAVMDRIRQLPGVETVAAGSPCINPVDIEGFQVAGQESPPQEQWPRANCKRVTEDYFATLRIRLRAGRLFTLADHAQAERVAIVNEMIARRYFPDGAALGQFVICKGNSCRIVGVVADERSYGLRGSVMPTIYIPFGQADWIGGGVEFMIRTRASVATMLTPLRREFVALNPLSPAPRMATLHDLLAGPVAPMRLHLQLLSLFSALALILASVGIYGLMAFFVSQRTQEIGIRMALGARRVDVLRSIVGQGLKLALVGAGLGLGGALALTRVLASLLYDVSPTDPLTFTFVSFVLLGMAALASYLPARRAARIDPMAALRYE